jgi:hypothetical protein
VITVASRLLRNDYHIRASDAAQRCTAATDAHRRWDEKNESRIGEVPAGRLDRFSLLGLSRASNFHDQATRSRF